MPRGGPRPNRGGARPGAGRPPSDVLDYRRQMQARVCSAVSQHDVDAIIAKAVEQAKGGDDRARAWLSPLVFGKVAERFEEGSQPWTINFVPWEPRDPAAAPAGAGPPAPR